MPGWSRSARATNRRSGGSSPNADVRRAMRSGRAVIGTPQRSLLSGMPLVPVSIPILAADGRPIGALTGTLSLHRLSELIESVRSETPRSLRIFDATGTLLVGPDRSLVLTASEERRAVAAGLDGQPAARETVAEDGTRVLATVAPAPGTGWFVQVEVPVSQIDTPIHVQLASAAPTALIAFLVATLVGWFAARRLTAPIMALRAAARGIDRGEDVAALLDIQSGEEIEDLARDLATLTGTWPRARPSASRPRPSCASATTGSKRCDPCPRRSRAS